VILEPLVAGHIHGVTYRDAGDRLFVLTVDLGELLTVDRGGTVRRAHWYHLEGVGDPEGLGLVSLDN
jgi:hypothetical protein